MALVSGMGGTLWECSVWMSWGLSVKGDSGRHTLQTGFHLLHGRMLGRGGLIQGDEGAPSQVQGQG